MSIKERLVRGEELPHAVVDACDRTYEFSVEECGLSKEDTSVLCEFAGDSAYYLISKFRENTDYETEKKVRLYELAPQIEKINLNPKLARLLPIVQLISFSAALESIVSKQHFYIGSE